MKLVDLAQFANQPETPTVIFAPERCLHRRHKEVSCQLCFGNCPTQAIIAGKPVAFDASRCISCGLCLHICPVDAFSTSGNRESRLKQTVRSLEGHRVELACSCKENMAVTKANVDVIVEVNPCLAMISLPTLLEMATQLKSKSGRDDEAVLWLNDEPCDGCPIGSVQSEISRTVDAANKMLATYGEKVEVLTCQGASERLGRQRKKQVMQQKSRRYSRRDFFRSLAKPELDKSDDADNALQQLPNSRKSLLNGLKSLSLPIAPQMDMSGLPFGSVVIEGECVACGLCARFCPSEALVFEKVEHIFHIKFKSAGCLGCNICTLACPTKAVELNSTVDTNKLLSGVVDLLVTGELASCQECGMDCAIDQDEPLCFVCQWRKTLPESDVYG